MQTRKGKVIELYDSFSSGVILDENEQEICFALKQTDVKLKPGDIVFFDIVLTTQGLMALILGL